MIQQSRDTYDSPWKDVLELYLEDFLALYFPVLHALVDWTRPVVSLDNELRQIFPDSELGGRAADKLFQVWTRDGECLEIMIHVEVQAQAEAAFPERMLVYHYRIYDRYHRPVVSLAVLCDDQPSFHPKSFTACDLAGCRFRLDFPTVKLLEYNDRWNELEASRNPFAVVAMAHLKTQATRSDPDERYRWKILLIRGLYDKGYDRDYVVNLFRFIDWVMRLPTELSRKFQETVHEIETENNVQYVTSIERLAIEDGIQQGMKQGILQGVQQGIQQGVQQGMHQGESRMLRRLLTHRFGDLPADVAKRLEEAGSEDIAVWSERIFSAQNLDEVFRD